MNRSTFDTNRKSSAMSARVRTIAFALRTLLVCVALAMPVLAMPAMSGVDGDHIEAPVSKKKGAGFVLLVSLQRA